MATPDEANADVRSRLSEELDAIRSKVDLEELVLFIGERMSILVSPENVHPSLDDWWPIVYDSKMGLKPLFDMEKHFLRNLQQAPSRVHNVLRNVGKFPLIITTNMDELLERLLWKAGNGGEKIRLDQISCLSHDWPNLERDVIVKCLGDGGFNARTLPSSKDYFQNFCNTAKSPEVEMMHKIFDNRSVLFLGCDPERPEYKNFFEKFAVNAEMKHYTFETCADSGLDRKGNLFTLKADIESWEFVQFLSTGTIQEEIHPGEVYERSYLRIQREDYLKQQLALEKQSSEIIFHTISITNALSPDEYLELVSRPTIEDIFHKDPFGVYSEEKVQRTLDAMKGRRDNLIRLITTSDTRVTALFFYPGVKKEIQAWRKLEESPPSSEREKQKILEKCKISISRYARAIRLCNSFMRSNSTLEILIVDDEETYKLAEKETFALIRIRDGSDEAVCYAETATSEKDRKFANQLVNINGDEAINKRKVFERSRAKAWSNNDSILKLASAIMKEHTDLKDKYPNITAISKDDLEALEKLTQIGEKIRSKLDPGYLEPVGAGNFGQVFKGTKNGLEVAVKVLNKVDPSSPRGLRTLIEFEREVDTLREAKHPNIVDIIECISIQNQLAIVMEFMAGGNLRGHINKHPGIGQGKEFTVRFIEHIGSAIEHLHSLSLMHRDVKPENILMSADSKVLKLGDFGLARETQGTNEAKTAFGSFRYMAPEVYTKFPGDENDEKEKAKQMLPYSKRADVYSFGLCLIEVLSGKQVHDDNPSDLDVFFRRKWGLKPTIPIISSAEFGEKLALKLKKIIDECLKVEDSRPEIHFLLNILRVD